ncbi:MAG: hypothetical protein ACR2QC_09225 [Gammaproteobacteria bacterium]
MKNAPAKTASVKTAPVVHKNFLDSRDKYLSFVRATDEKVKTAFYLARRVGAPSPRRPFYVLDAGAGEGTIISTFLTALHKKIPRTPIVVVAKEISIDDICILLGYLPDRFAEHPSLVFHITNLDYREMANPAAGFRRFRRELRGEMSHDFGLQLMNMSAFVKKHFALAADSSGAPRPRQKIALTIYRKDRKDALAALVSAPAPPSQFDFIVASHPFRLRRPPSAVAAAVVAPLLRMLRGGGRMVLTYASGRDFSRPLLRLLYPQIAPYASAAPSKLLRALRAIPECAATAASARVSAMRYGFINLYLGRREFSLGNIYSLWNAVVYVGQIGEGEQKTAAARGLPRLLREKLARVRDKSFVNHIIHFTKTRGRKGGRTD